MPALDLQCRLGCDVRPGVSGFKDQSHHAAPRRKDAVLSTGEISLAVALCATMWQLKLNSNSGTSALIVAIWFGGMPTACGPMAAARRSRDGRSSGSKPFLA